MNELDQYDALGLAGLVRSGRLGAAELLEAFIARVEARNPSVNAVVRRMYDEARRDIAAGLPDGPFSGVPFMLKDLRAEYGGVPTTSGSRLFCDKVAREDSELVRRHRRAGLVIFGKTNTSEFGCCPSTEGTLFGATRNPWNRELSAGGSSGGSAAAVAAGLVPLAHGSDGGGSIRIPAACCGVFGFKPTRGVNPAGPVFGEAWNGLSAEHALTRSVRDSAALLDATRGPAPGDPYCGPTFERSMLEEVGRSPGRLRVAVQRHALSGAPVHADCVAAVDECAKLLEDLGHHVEEGVPSYDVARIGAAYPLVIAANVQAAIDEYSEATGITPGPEHVDNVIGILGRMGHDRSAADLARAVWAMHAVGRQVAPFFGQHDVVLTPVVATPPPPIGTLDTSTDDIKGYLEAVFRFIPFTALANIAGLPAMAVPRHWRQDGLPIGVHFTAGFGRDGLLFSLAAQLEAARPWAGRRPPAGGQQP
jgi:Asp-tRNA(Asn)/Glu-tRNA(Gln) amidotransferase A subunit family amidase